MSLSAQDVHFSQFFWNPLSTNVAAAGDFVEDYRVVGIHRNQWRSVTTPFSTFQVSADASNAFKQRNLGLGLRLMNDRAGDSRLNTFSIGATVAGITKMNADSSTTLHAGLELGYTQRSIDYSALRYDAQYNGSFYESSLPNGELERLDKLGHLDINAGLYLKHKINRFDYWTIGFGLWNLSSPEVNFGTDERVNLRQRLSVHAEYVRQMNKTWDIMPSLRAMFQGPYQEYLFGARLRHTWRHDAIAKRRILIGAHGRLDDAGYISLGLEHDDWTVGLSYDINLSPLEVASRNRGAFEILLIKVFDVFDEERKLHRKCFDLL